jgi:hypothetical protein
MFSIIKQPRPEVILVTLSPFNIVAAPDDGVLVRRIVQRTLSGAADLHAGERAAADDIAEVQTIGRSIGNRHIAHAETGNGPVVAA